MMGLCPWNENLLQTFFLHIRWIGCSSERSMGQQSLLFLFIYLLHYLPVYLYLCIFLSIYLLVCRSILALRKLFQMGASVVHYLPINVSEKFALFSRRKFLLAKPCHKVIDFPPTQQHFFVCFNIRKYFVLHVFQLIQQLVVHRLANFFLSLLSNTVCGQIIRNVIQEELNSNESI